MSKIQIERSNHEGGNFAAKFKQIFLDIAKTISILAAAVLVSELLFNFGLDRQSCVMMYLIAVIVISLCTSGYIYGISAAVVSTFVFDFLIASPRMAFSFTAGSPFTLLTMLAATVVITTLTSQMRKQTQLAVDREHRAQLLYEINQNLLAARSMDAIIELTTSYLSSHLTLPVVFHTSAPTLSGEENGNMAYPDGFGSEAELKLVRGIFQNGAPSDMLIGEDLPRISYIPVTSKQKVLGVIGVDCRKKPLNQASSSFLQMFAGQLSFALEVQTLSDEQTNIAMEAEREKARSTLLRSVSHDLRTPLTGILGTASTILEQSELDDSTIRNLVGDIKENVQWLIRMVENILTITRITGGHIQLNKTMEAAEEIVAQTVSNIRKRFPDYYFQVSVPDELLIIPMDATLVSQALINLIENAAKNSQRGSLVLIDLKKNGDFAQFDINDNGSGVPTNLLDHLFEVHSPQNERVVDGARGIGIGLSICKTIAAVHGGTIEGGNRKGGGARFSFQLPLQERNS